MIKESAMNTYEGMFLLDPIAAQKDWTKVRGEVESLLKKHGSEIVIMDKWAERKLTYPIRKQQRGTYLLTYFKAPAAAIAKINGDCNLSETIMRALILRHEGEVGKITPPPAEGMERGGPPRREMRYGESQ
ncbi:MAG: 30S ribosomal protein S6 [Planctomycetes bacterium RBG_16_59_8]|nr:MAG: 30S ribosomal protein S6 [Planctomycetes bacterium RBG_16_59_8]